jgi:hypothetical protein
VAVILRGAAFHDQFITVDSLDAAGSPRSLALPQPGRSERIPRRVGFATFDADALALPSLFALHGFSSMKALVTS